MEGRKTLTAEDLIAAAQTLGFDNYAELLKLYVQKHREDASRSARSPIGSGYGGGGGSAGPASAGALPYGYE